MPPGSEQRHPAPAVGQGHAGGRGSELGSGADLSRAAVAALRRGQWQRARDGFEAVLEKAESPHALEGLAEAAWWLEDASQVLAARQRAYRLFREAGDDLGAGRTATELGFDHAVFRLEMAVANGWFQRAHRLLDELEPIGEQAWLRLREAEIAYHTAGDMTSTRKLAERARVLAARLGLLDAEMMALALEGLALVGLGEVDDGFRRLDEAAVAATGGEVKGHKAVAAICCFVIFACEQVRDIERASQWCEQYMAYCHRNDMPGYLAFCRAHHASVMAARGHWADAEGELSRASEQLTARPAWSLTVFERLGELRRRQGNFDEAAALFERSQPHPGGVLGLARLALDQGDPETARDLVEGLLNRTPAADRVKRLPALELVTGLRCAAGEMEAADEAVAEFEAVAETVGTDWLKGTASRLRGRLALAGGDPATARAALQSALDAYQRLDLPYETSLVRSDLARVLHALGRDDLALEQARVASSSLDGLGATADAEKVQAMLEELTTPDPSAVDGLLTPRETEVLRLLATRGATNQEIADELVVSPHTVRRHVSNLLSKIGVDSRTAAAVWARDHDLV